MKLLSQWGTADVEIKVPSIKNTELANLSFCPSNFCHPGVRRHYEISEVHAALYSNKPRRFDVDICIVELTNFLEKRHHLCSQRLFPCVQRAVRAMKVTV